MQVTAAEIANPYSRTLFRRLFGDAPVALDERAARRYLSAHKGGGHFFGVPDTAIFADPAVDAAWAVFVYAAPGLPTRTAARRLASAQARRLVEILG